MTANHDSNLEGDSYLLKVLTFDETSQIFFF